MYIPIFLDRSISGDSLLQVDSSFLKQIGVMSKADRDKIKDKLKELRKLNDKEKKKAEKERKGGKGGLKTTFLR